MSVYAGEAHLSLVSLTLRTITLHKHPCQYIYLAHLLIHTPTQNKKNRLNIEEEKVIRRLTEKKKKTESKTKAEEREREKQDEDQQVDEGLYTLKVNSLIRCQKEVEPES